VDFGVAKAATSSVKTRTGALKGKISYMSPEQAKGSPIDRRSDIFSLGIVLWEMVVTRRLFKADNDLATIQKIIHSRPPPPTELRAQCSPELGRIVMRALAADVDARYQTAEELQLDLEELAREQKLKQSTVALRAHMQELFAEDIVAWDLAKASGVTLIDHVVARSDEPTTAISDSELSYVDEDEDPDSEPPTAGPDAPTRQMSLARVPTVPPDVPHPAAVTPSSPFPRATTEANAFPVAPLEWRPPAELPPEQAVRSDRRRKLIIVASACAFSAIVLIALIFVSGP
jgi:serine/threonine protein kinase